MEFLTFKNFTIHPNIQKAFLFLDGTQSAIIDTLSFINFLKQMQTSPEIMVVIGSDLPNRIDFIKTKLAESNVIATSFSINQIKNLLITQKVGTYLYLFAQWQTISAVKQAAMEVGFSNEEIQCKGYGNKEEMVFCVKCYKLNLKSSNHEIICEYCSSLLDVTNQYSIKLDAYLGNIKVK